jgi:glycosyltransferase involved in cell wall biosynthesis
MPYPLLALFDPVRFLVLLVHGLLESRHVKPSFVLASMPPLETGLCAWFLSKICHAKLVVDLRDDWESAVENQLRNYFPIAFIRVLSTIASKVYSSAYVIFVVTQTILDTIRRRGVHKPMLLVPNGADTEIFKPESQSIRLKTRIDYCIPTDKFVTIYCGSGINPYYRLDLVLSSISLLPRKVSERMFFLFYVYSGSSNLKRLVRLLKISSDLVEIRSPLPRSKLAKVMAACDTGLVPFDSKQYLLCARSTKIYEYLSAGLYTISSGPSGGELDLFLSKNPELGSFTTLRVSDFARSLSKVAERGEVLFKDVLRESRYRFIKENYDRKNTMENALNSTSNLLNDSERRNVQ